MRTAQPARAPRCAESICRRTGSVIIPPKANPGDSRVLPRDDDLTGRNAEDRQRHVARRDVELERDDGGRRGDEGFAGRTKDSRARDVKLADTPVDELAVRSIRAHEERARRDRVQAPDEHEVVFALPVLRTPAGADPR